MFETFFEQIVFGNDGDTKPDLFICRLLLRPCNLSHRVERQKLMVNSREEMSVLVRKCGLVANLFLRQNVGPNVLFEKL